MPAAAAARVRHDDHLAVMLREASQPDGLHRLLRWTAQQVAGEVALVSGTGQPLRAFPEVPRKALDAAAEDIDKVGTGQLRAAALDVDDRTVCAVAVGEPAPEAVLVVVAPRPMPATTRTIVADAARLLWLRWRGDEAERQRRRLALADAQNREAVLHLLMVGHVSGARRSAAALGPELANTIRVYVVECADGAREEGARRCEEASGGRAWIVRCPVYRRHLIVLAPTEPDPQTGPRFDDIPVGGPVDHALRRLAATHPNLYVGASHAVGLRDTATGYSQAFHALALARTRPERYAGFTPQGGLAQLLGTPGCVWARQVLNPLLSYVCRRRQDPDAAELLITLMSWLTFHSGAAAQLQIHRNTLYGRIRHIERLLGYRLDGLSAQATIHLAMRLLDEPLHESPAPGPDPTLDTLLDSPAVRRWATDELAPLLAPEQAVVLATLRAWFGNNTRLEPTAAALGISVPGVRKRLIRAEEALGRALLDGPAGRYDMWFALQIHKRPHATRP